MPIAAPSYRFAVLDADAILPLVLVAGLYQNILVAPYGDEYILPSEPRTAPRYPCEAYVPPVPAMVISDAVSVLGMYFKIVAFNVGKK